MNQFTPKISIIIPVYNTENYIEKCLLSIINQTYRNIEIIIIDDGSTDSSSDICKKYLKIDNRILYIKITNSGLSNARNIGIKKSSGDYISFVDSDDFLDLATYENYIRYIPKNKNKNILISGYKKFKNKNLIYTYLPTFKKLKRMEAIEELIQDNTFCNYVWNKLYSKDFFDVLSFKINTTYEDIEIQYKLFEIAESITTCPFISYSYMIRCNSITTSQNINFQIDNLKIHLERYRYLKNLKINTKLLRFAENGILSSFLNLIFLIHKNKNYTFKYKRKIFADKLKKIMLKNNLPIFKKIILYIALKNNIYFDIIIVYIKKFCLNFK